MTRENGIPRLSAPQLDAYLHRVGLQQPPPATLEGLSELHHAHALHVPFENLDIHLGRPIALDVPVLFTKIVEDRRGGFCYEQNFLFASALTTLGFEVELLSARVRNAEGNFGPPFDHMVLRVVLPGGPYAADVGFGECFREPIPMNGQWYPQPDGSSYRLAGPGSGEEMTLEHRRTPEDLVAVDYKLDLKSRRPDEYAPMCRYHQSSPDSHFTRKWICSLATPDGRITARPGLFTETRSGRRDERRIESLDVLVELLQKKFGMTGIELPADFPWREMV